MADDFWQSRSCAPFVSEGLIKIIHYSELKQLAAE